MLTVFFLLPRPDFRVSMIAVCAWLCLSALGAALADSTVAADRGPGGAAPQVRNAWVQVVPPSEGLLRVIVDGKHCPVALFDRRPARMSVRARPDSDFDVLVCELPVPHGTRKIEVGGRTLKPVSPRPQRIAILGDTGCRMKAGNALDDGFQNCSDTDDWEFAKVARRIAEWQPDLIIQLGDYIYQEQQCPAGCALCQGRSFNSPGMRMETWNEEFFVPAGPMLEAAPLVLIRGDHERCERAGRGYFRFLDPMNLGQQCADFSDPYALDFENLQLVIMDTVQAGDTEAKLSPEVVLRHYSQDFERAAALATGDTWLLSHRPIWAFQPKPRDTSAAAIAMRLRNGPGGEACGNQKFPRAHELEVEPINVSVQEALHASDLRGSLPAEVEVVLTSHVHVGEILSFLGDRPPELTIGNGGTKLLPTVDRGLIRTVIDGELVRHATMIESVHGFFGLTPRRRGGWQARALDVYGDTVASCRIKNRQARCRTR